MSEKAGGKKCYYSESTPKFKVSVNIIGKFQKQIIQEQRERRSSLYFDKSSTFYIKEGSGPFVDYRKTSRLSQKMCIITARLRKNSVYQLIMKGAKSREAIK